MSGVGLHSVPGVVGSTGFDPANRVDLLLATYNGVKFLPQLLESLESQTFTNWRVLVRDDGSTDGTLELLNDWVLRLGERARLISDELGNLGPAGNFSRIMEVSDAPYFLPCDQDDVWLPKKIETLMNLVREAEGRAGKDAPLIAHSDLFVVDGELNELHPSFWQHESINPRLAQTPKKLLIQNTVTGCAMIGNAALRNRAHPVPECAPMHDWWLALVAAFLGEVVFTDEKTVRYRQHDSNEVGAVEIPNVPQTALRSLYERGYFLRGFRLNWDNMTLKMLQSGELAQRFANELSDQDRAVCQEFANLRSKSFLARKAFPARHRLWASGPLRNAIILLVI